MMYMWIASSILWRMMRDFFVVIDGLIACNYRVVWGFLPFVVQIFNLAFVTLQSLYNALWVISIAVFHFLLVNEEVSPMKGKKLQLPQKYVDLAFQLDYFSILSSDNEMLRFEQESQ